MTFNIGMIQTMVVCLCQGVSEKHVRSAIDTGARNRREVTAACGAGGVCGGCHSTIVEMIRECRRAAPANAVAALQPETAAASLG